MITIDNVRFNGTEFRSPSRHVIPSIALRSLLKYELGFGGSIKDINIEPTYTKIVVRTEIFGSIDIVTFTGNKDEMSLLLQACQYFLALKKHTGQTIEERVFQNLNDLYANTLVFTRFGPILAGTSISKLVMIAMAGIETEADAMNTYCLEDKTFWSVIELMIETKEPLETVLALAE